MLLVLLVLFLPAADGPSATEPMHGAFNIAVVTGAAPGLSRELARELRAWAGDPASIDIRTLTGHEGADLERTAVEEGADVVLRPVIHPAGAHVVSTVELFVGDRAMAETPEFAGRHDLTVREPAGAPPGELTETTRRYLTAVVTFIRGLGAYANADYPAAEQHFVRAGEDFDQITTAGKASGAHRVVVDLMAGNAAGRINPARAVPHYLRALERQPGYDRARIGLAEAYRTHVRCSPGSDLGLLDQAEENYRRAVNGSPDNPLVAMKAYLGLGLSSSCRGQAGVGAGVWTTADLAYYQVLQRYDAGHADRNARWLAAEATAGIGLSALVGREDIGAAAGHYESAVELMAGIAAPAPMHLERQAVFLRVLQYCYVRLDQPDRALRTDARLRDIERRLAEMTPGR